ncbi:hypothetical protein Oscil6304_3850 [Oscillatoria acuminata PCC 6304]|uniref:Uncharacterized protein n=1 Tax=Oscillatoria acuminata PCC 6304 TaxID=56110 RepID=K9TLJ9_9CYAN|nr:hypothetical protein Oscil6304_3850 [Oscillatoria acuminata PCC 6304]
MQFGVDGYELKSKLFLPRVTDHSGRDRPDEGWLNSNLGPSKNKEILVCNDSLEGEPARVSPVSQVYFGFFYKLHPRIMRQ